MDEQEGANCWVRKRESQREDYMSEREKAEIRLVQKRDHQCSIQLSYLWHEVESHEGLPPGQCQLENKEA